MVSSRIEGLLEKMSSVQNEHPGVSFSNSPALQSSEEHFDVDIVQSCSNLMSRHNQHVVDEDDEMFNYQPMSDLECSISLLLSADKKMDFKMLCSTSDRVFSIFITVAEQPRPGKVNSLLADRFQMVLLTRACPTVYVYQTSVEQASRRKTASSCAAYLLNVFYTTTELVGRNLTGANGKIAIDKEILESIINFTMAYHKDSTESIIRLIL
ncbi:hypothetical protein AC249_AIPGENE23439 [Exaiptasia diaphana]|nr:hypothetical protein AC249_AIPGENE23439 [Exaiptasia diaphana]